MAQAHPFQYIIHEISWHKALRFLDQTDSKKGENELIDAKLWKNLRSKCFNLIYLKDTNSYVIIFRHVDKDEVDDLSDRHTKECLTGGKPKPQKLPRYVTEEIVELFSTAPLSDKFLEDIKKTYPKIVFEYCHIDRRRQLSQEKEALFIILTRLFNFDLHHEEIEEELVTSTLRDREDFISH